MAEKINTTKYSQKDLEKIRKRAQEIWQRKCQSLNTALDDWLEAERDLRKQLKIEHKSSSEYTQEEFQKIKERAEEVRKTKVQSLRTAFNDWIEAEHEFKEELKKKINVNELFDLWFGKASASIISMLKTDDAVSSSTLNDVLSQQYIELMAECMN